MTTTNPGVSTSVRIARPPAEVWPMVADVSRMGEWSQENTGGVWRAGASGPAVGATFVGRNRNGVRRWSTRCTVTQCEPGRRFAFRVRSIGLPIAIWAYEFTADGDGCTVRESWTDQRSWVMKVVGRIATGRPHDAADNLAGMEATLHNLKTAAER